MDEKKIQIIKKLANVRTGHQNKTKSNFGSTCFILSKPQAWYGINALAHCMESPKAYGITRKRA